jgi:hypothetical protein
LSSSFVHAQAKAYAALGHRVRVLVPLALGKRDWNGSRTAAEPWQADGVELVPMRYVSISKYGKRRFNTQSAILALYGRVGVLLDGFQPDIIHAHTLGFDSEIGAWLKGRLGCPLVVTTHGSDTSIPMEQGQRGKMKALCDQADMVVAVSSVLADKLRACGTETPIRPILNGFARTYMPSKRQKTPVSLLQAGTLNHQKRVAVTIRAFSRVKALHPDATLTLVGQGPDRHTLEDLCGALGVSHAARFTGQLPNPQVMEEMSRARFFVMPSVREGFGIVYLEAMACGCVTIGTEGEGISDLIVSGENGFLVPPGDWSAIVQVIEWCLSHPEEADAIAERGRQDAMRLTWPRNAEAYLALFTQLLSKESAKT